MRRTPRSHPLVRENEGSEPRRAVWLFVRTLDVDRDGAVHHDIREAQRVQIEVLFRDGEVGVLAGHREDATAGIQEGDHLASHVPECVVFGAVQNVVGVHVDPLGRYLVDGAVAGAIFVRHAAVGVGTRVHRSELELGLARGDFVFRHRDGASTEEVLVVLDVVGDPVEGPLRGVAEVEVEHAGFETGDDLVGQTEDVAILVHHVRDDRGTVVDGVDVDLARSAVRVAAVPVAGAGAGSEEGHGREGQQDLGRHGSPHGRSRCCVGFGSMGAKSSRIGVS